MTTITDTYIATALRNFGLSEKEASIYQVCLASGEIGVTRLSRLVRLSRSTTYFVADELVKKGVLRFIQKGAHRIYSAEDPRKLSAIINKQKITLNKRASFLESILPELVMRFSDTPNKPVVSYYQGQIEVRRILDDILVSGTKEEFWTGEMKTLEEAVGKNYLQKWTKKRIDLGIKSISVRPLSDKKSKIYGPSKSNLRKVQYAPEGFESPSLIVIYGNKVAFISSVVESYGVLVESKDLSTTLRSWFTILQKSCKQK